MRRITWEELDKVTDDATMISLALLVNRQSLMVTKIIIGVMAADLMVSALTNVRDRNGAVMTLLLSASRLACAVYSLHCGKFTSRNRKLTKTFILDFQALVYRKLNYFVVYFVTLVMYILLPLMYL